MKDHIGSLFANDRQPCAFEGLSSFLSNPDIGVQIDFGLLYKSYL
jgi:hypothetical protein